MKLAEELKGYEPYNEQEERDKEMMLALLASSPLIFSRENTSAHMSASAWVTNKTHDKVLMAYHNIYDSWAWTGGHADGEEDLFAVAEREVREETGIKTLTPVSNDIFSIEVLTVDGHYKNGKYVSSHLHLNVTYLFEADETEALRIKADENSKVGWFTLDGCIEACNEPWMNQWIYKKLNEKLNEMGLVGLLTENS